MEVKKKKSIKFVGKKFFLKFFFGNKKKKKLYMNVLKNDLLNSNIFIFGKSLKFQNFIKILIKNKFQNSFSFFNILTLFFKSFFQNKNYYKFFFFKKKIYNKLKSIKFLKYSLILNNLFFFSKKIINLKKNIKIKKNNQNEILNNLKDKLKFNNIFKVDKEPQFFFFLIILNYLNYLIFLKDFLF